MNGARQWSQKSLAKQDNINRPRTGDTIKYKQSKLKEQRITQNSRELLAAGEVSSRLIDLNFLSCSGVVYVDFGIDGGEDVTGACDGDFSFESVLKFGWGWPLPIFSVYVMVSDFWPQNGQAAIVAVFFRDTKQSADEEINNRLFFKQTIWIEWYLYTRIVYNILLSSNVRNPENLKIH